MLPAGRAAAAGGCLLAGLVNPAYLLFMLANTGTGDVNPCLGAMNAALDAKGESRGMVEPLQEAPAGAISPIGGCSPLRRR